MHKHILRNRLYATIKSMKCSVFILIFISIFGVFSVAHAQLNLMLETEINVTVIPENPGANEKVVASVTSYGTDLNAAKITWGVDGKIIKSGTGVKSFGFTTGSPGTETVLDITIETAEGQNIKRTVSVKPVSVDLLWQSESFIPPFYKGKAMFSHQNKVTFIAVPHIIGSNGTEISSANLIYKWKKNGSVIEDASGFGKNTYSLVGSLISRPMSVSVNVTSMNGDGVGFASVNLNPSEPQIIFYNKSPIYGIEFQKALGGTVGMGKSRESTIIGQPLFFGVTNSVSRDLTYKWSVNGEPTAGYNEDSQVFRKPDGVGGVSSIELNITNNRKILQYASNSFNLSFGK